MSSSDIKKSGSKIYEAALLKFSGVEGYDVYNCSIPFIYHGNTYIFGRVEKRNLWADSYVFLFRKVDEDVYECVSESRQYQLEDPYVFIWHDEIILGGTHITKEHGEVKSFCSYFYRGKDLMNLHYFATGADNMKDVRLVLLPNDKIGVFSRPRNNAILAEFGSESMIGFATIKDINELDAVVINNAEYIPGIFENGQWGGCNQAYLLDNGKVGVIGHLSNRIKDENGNELLSYKNISFLFDPTEKKANGLRVLATRSDYPEGPAKMPNLVDCAFTSGIELRADGKVNLYSGIGDCEEGRVVIDNPFCKEGAMISKCGL